MQEHQVKRLDAELTRPSVIPRAVLSVEVYPEAYSKMGHSGIDWCYLNEPDENGMNSK